MSNLKVLLFSLSLFLLFSPHFAALDNSPSPSPASSPYSDWDDDDVADGPDFPSPSPSPVADAPNSPSPSPTADGPTTSDSPSPSPGAAAPTPTSDSPSPSPAAAATTPTSDSPSPSPGADAPTPTSDATSPSPGAAAPTATFDAPAPSPGAAAPSSIDSIAGLAGSVVDAEVLGVLETAIRSSAELAKTGLAKAKEEVNNTSIPPEQASMLMECRDSYDYAVYNFENAIDSLPEKDFDTVKSMLKAIVEDVGDCESRLSKFGGENPFAGVGDKLVSMTNNCLTIAAQIK